MRDLSLFKILALLYKKNLLSKGMLLVPLVLNLVIVIINVIRPYLVQMAIDKYTIVGDLIGATIFSIVIIVISFLYVFMGYYFDKMSKLLGIYVAKHLREMASYHLFQLPKKFFDNTRSGVVTTRLTSDIEAISAIFEEGLMFILPSNLILLLGCLIVMFSLNELFSVVVIGVLLIILIITLIFRGITQKIFLEIRQRIAQLNAFINEEVLGKFVIEVFNKKKVREEKFDELNEAYFKEYKRAVFSFATFFPIVDFFLHVGIALILAFGIYQITKGISTIGEIVSFIMYLYIIFTPIRTIADKIYTFEMGNVAAKRVLDFLLREPAGVHSCANSIPFPSIEFVNVSFGYEDDNFILRDVSFTIRPGDKVLIYGPTGEGKSTILHLIRGYYFAQSGAVKIGNIRIEDIDPVALGKYISYVSQDVFVFSGSVLENIILFNSQSSKVSLIKELYGSYFVEVFPSLDMQVLEGGRNLSVSQKQIIAFLRLFIGTPEIILLDEPSASLSSSLEEVLFKLLKEYFHRQTICVVSHKAISLDFFNRKFLVLDRKVTETKEVLMPIV